MTDPNQTPAANEPNPPSAYDPPAPPAYSSPAPAYGAAPAAPQAYTAGGYGAPAGQDKWNVLAIVSLVSAFFISLAAVICGHIALGQIKRTGEKGRGLAIAGLVLGYLGLLAGIITIIAVIVITMAAINDGSYSTTY
jgi:ABC-type spermidine/putrescine transport system permease subunit II